MIEIVSKTLPTITKENFKDELHKAGITSWDEELLDHPVIKERVFSKVVPPSVETKLVLFAGKKLLPQTLKQHLLKEKLKEVPGYSLHYFLEALKHFNEEELRSTALPVNSSILMPMNPKRWMYVWGSPAVFCIHRDGTGNRKLTTIHSQQIIEPSTALILQKYHV